MHILKNFLLVVSTGYIFVFFSEHLFWAHIRPGDSLAGWLGAWIVYSLLAFVFLVFMVQFRVRNLWALFLVGAILGWLAEGLIVQTAYEMLPLSLSFTGLAWHALLTVWVGWYAIQKALHSPRLLVSFKRSGLIGLAHGFWAVNWWSEPDGKVSTLLEFGLFMFTITTLVVCAYWLANWSSKAPLRFGRWSILTAAALLTVYFFLVTVPAAPIALVLLPALLGLAWWGLRQNRMAEAEGSLVEIFSAPVPAWNYLGLFGLPAASVLVYALALFANWQAQTNWILYLLTTPSGFILFFISLYHLWRRARSSTVVEGEAR